MLKTGKKKWSYENIAKALKRGGFYDKIPLKKAVVLARKDYETACNILETSRKRYRRPGKTIVALKGLKGVKADVEYWNGVLEKHGCEPIIRETFAPNHGKNGAYYYKGGDMDGHLKERIKREME